MTAKKSKTIDAYLIIFVIAALAFVLSHVIPHGAFELTPGTDARIDPASYARVENASGAPLFGNGDNPGFLNFLFEGLVSGDRNSASVGLMAFILIIGGSFGVIMRTGAIERAIRVALARQKGPNDVFVVGLFVAFSLAGAVFGMSEEAIVFTLIVAPALMRAGYDSITAVVCCYAATQIGFATSWMNPFNVVIAQGIADVPALSGAPFRMIMWVVFTTVGALMAFFYARRVRQTPERSLAFGSDASWRAEFAVHDKSDDTQRLRVGDWLVLGVVAAGVAWVAWGVAALGYYLPEIAAQFFAMGVAAGLIGRVFKMNDVDGNDLVGAFRDGAVQLAPAAIIVAAAKGVVLLLGGDDPTAPSALNTILHELNGATGMLPNWAAAWSMLAVQSVINLFVVSGSGQAALTMPLMAPLADLNGVSRQIAVLGFQLGDGLTNIVVPASAALMGSLAAARLDWVIWLRFVWKPLFFFMALASAFVLIANVIGYS